MPPKKPPPDPKRSRAQVLERDRLAFELRQQGKNFDQIATELGFANKGSAHKAYTRAMARGRIDGTSVADERELELARLDALQSEVWKAASRGDLSAVDKVLKIMARRDRLLGLAVAAHAASRQSDSSRGGDPSKVVVGRDRLDEMREARERNAADRSARS